MFNALNCSDTLICFSFWNALYIIFILKSWLVNIMSIQIFFRSFFFSEKVFFTSLTIWINLSTEDLAMWLIFFFSVLSTNWVHGHWQVYLTLLSISLLEAIAHWYILLKNRENSLVIILGVWCERTKRNYLNNF